MSESPTKKSRSLNEATINAAYNGKLAGKPTITEEEKYVDNSTTHVEESFSEISKSYTNSYTKDTPQNKKATMMSSSKTRNYHIRDILYNIYKYNKF